VRIVTKLQLKRAATKNLHGVHNDFIKALAQNREAPYLVGHEPTPPQI
jgi:hypothetical protein